MVDQNVGEEWRDVPGYEGWYSVSNLGRVRRDKGGVGCRAGHVLLGPINSRGYRHVMLYKHGVSTQIPVHVIVAAVFIGPRPPGTEINHRGADGDKTNNLAANLEYVTRAENCAHSRYVIGNAACAKLTPALVMDIRDKYATGGFTRASLARLYGVSANAIGCVVLGKTWARVGGATIADDQRSRRASTEVRKPSTQRSTPMPKE